MVDSKQIKKVLGATVKELRLQKHLTQEQLAEHVGLQPQTVAKLEIGGMFVSSEVLSKLSNFFEVDPMMFFTKKVKILTDEDKNLIQDIKHMLPTFEISELRKLHDIMLILKD